MVSDVMNISFSWRLDFSCSKVLRTKEQHSGRRTSIKFHIALLHLYGILDWTFWYH